MTDAELALLAREAPLQPLAGIGWRLAPAARPPLEVCADLESAHRLQQLLTPSEADPLPRAWPRGSLLSSGWQPAWPVLAEDAESALALADEKLRQFVSDCLVPFATPLRCQAELQALAWESPRVARLHGRHFRALHPHLLDEAARPLRQRLAELLLERGCSAIQLPAADPFADRLLTLLLPGTKTALRTAQRIPVFAELTSIASRWLCDGRLYRFAGSGKNTHNTL